MKIKSLFISSVSVLSLLAGSAVFADETQTINAKFSTLSGTKCGIRTGCTATITPVSGTMSATCQSNLRGIPSSCSQYSPLKNLSPNPLVMKAGYSYSYTPSWTIVGSSDIAVVVYPAGSVWANMKVTVVGSNPLVTKTVPCILSGTFNRGDAVNVGVSYTTTSTAISAASCTITKQ